MQGLRRRPCARTASARWSAKSSGVTPASTAQTESRQQPHPPWSRGRIIRSNARKDLSPVVYLGLRHAPLSTSRLQSDLSRTLSAGHVATVLPSADLTSRQEEGRMRLSVQAGVSQPDGIRTPVIGVCARPRSRAHRAFKGSHRETTPRAMVICIAWTKRRRSPDSSTLSSRGSLSMTSESRTAQPSALLRKL